MNNLSEKDAVTLVEFRYGDPVVFVRYTDGTDDFGSFVSTPEVGVKFPAINGSLKENPVQIALPSDTFSLAIASTIAFPPLFVTIYEKIDEDVSTIYLGRCTRAIRNYQGRRGRVMVEAISVKSRLEVALGIMVNHTCPYIFLGRGCNQAPFVPPVPETGTVTVIAGTTVTITGLSTTPPRLWHRGYIERNDLRIGIREWISGTSFLLTRKPPDAWLNQTVTAVQGCDKTIETCRTIWNNESNFGGAGYAMASRDPRFEKP